LGWKVAHSTSDGLSNTWTNAPVVALYRTMAPSYDPTASKLCWTFPPTSFAMYDALNATHDIESVCGWDNGTVAVCIVTSLLPVAATEVAILCRKARSSPPPEGMDSVWVVGYRSGRRWRRWHRRARRRLLWIDLRLVVLLNLGAGWVVATRRRLCLRRCPSLHRLPSYRHRRERLGWHRLRLPSSCR